MVVMATRINNPYYSEKSEECGIFGIYSKKGVDVAPYIYRALVALQHRGQDAAGLAVYDGKAIEARKGIGLANSMFQPEDLKVKGKLGIGHTRYPTHGECNMCDVQPVVFRDIAAAHNGHLANYPALKERLEADGYEFMSSVDSEAMVFMLHRKEDVEAAVKSMMGELEGAYSVSAIAHGELVVFRDPFAIRPLVWGENDDFICFASESVALDAVGVPYLGDVKGGEIVIVGKAGMRRRRLVAESPRHCMFEFVYFSRPDSVIDQISVHKARDRLGEELAGECPAQADIIIPVPDTSRTAASGYARKLGIPCEEGLIKNRYIGRTFIMPDQEGRREAVRMKLNPVRELVRGKSVVLVDDSIVRGTTLKEIVGIMRSAGAKRIHLRITCPPLTAPCFYGVDMSGYKELIANKKTIGQIREYLGADSLGYVSLGGLKEAIGVPVCTACLDEKYLTEYVQELATRAKGGG